jgi:DNA-binding transcriptional regulator YhcF (GntR family)
MASELNPQPAGRVEAPAHVAPPVPANVRAILRVGNEFFLRSIDSMAGLAGDDLIKALIYGAMWTANVKHITNSPANAQYSAIDEIPPDDLRMPVSVMALSNTLRIPYETVRRYVHTLMNEGACLRVGRKGFIVPAAVHARQAQREAIRENYPSLLRLLAELKRAGFDFAPYRRRLPQTKALPANGEMPSNARAILRVAMELVMHGIDVLGSMHNDDFLLALIFTAIWTSNVHHITSTADNLRYGALNDLPPDELRRPVTVHAVANSLRIPYETVRRYANRMVKDGSAVRIGGRGLIVPRERLAVDAGFDSVRNAYIHIDRTIAGLHRAGFDFSGY